MEKRPPGARVGSDELRRAEILDRAVQKRTGQAGASGDAERIKAAKERDERSWKILQDVRKRLDNNQG